LIDEAPIPGGLNQQHPARSARQRIPHGHELSPPPLEAAEISDECIEQSGIGFASPTESIEEQFVQDHRVRGDELLALEPVHHEHRCLGEIEVRQLLGDCIQPLHGAPVVVLVAGWMVPGANSARPGISCVRRASVDVAEIGIRTKCTQSHSRCGYPCWNLFCQSK
jgi:hypothetical protein